VNEETLREFFAKYYSSVVGTKIIVDPVTKISKGYGFVKFSEISDAQRALIEMNGKNFKGRPMKTK
jgi:RNA recognition motif-containing protein